MSALSRRRGACPALSAPMETGDGLLVRLVPADGIFAPRALVGLARAAQAFGNGILEVTARGSLQIRGLSEASVGPLNEAVTALALVPREGLAIDASPLAGIDASAIADARLLAQEIGAAVAAAGLLPRLGPKVSVVIDGGGACPLDASKADVRLHAVRAGDGVAWQIALAGDAARAHPFATLGRREAVAAVVDLLTRIAALGRAARMEDVLRGPASAVAAEGAAAAHGASPAARANTPPFPAPSTPQEPQGPLSRLRGRVGEGEECLDAAPQPTGTDANAEADAGDLAPLPPQALASPPPPDLAPPPPQPSPASGRGGVLALGENDLSMSPAPAAPLGAASERAGYPGQGAVIGAVMAGPVPAIHAGPQGANGQGRSGRRDVDPRDEPGDDEERSAGESGSYGLSRLPPQDFTAPPPPDLAPLPPPQPSPASGRGGAVVFGERDFAPRHAHPSPEARPGPLHLHPLADGSFARGIGLPFGALEAETFIALIEAAERAGAREIRLAPGRALLAIGLTQDGAAHLEQAAATLGLLTDPADPRGFVAACPGAPACASGLLPARALAPQVARALAPLLDGSFEIHVSGCAKGCAHPAPAAVTLVGREPAPARNAPAPGAQPNDVPVGNLPAVDFPIALVREGTAQGVALAALAPVALVPTLTRLAAPGRQPGESGAQALSRLLAQAFKERSA